MIKYARYISETSVAFPSRSEFAGVVGWETNDAEMRAHGYLPLEGVPQEVDGKTLALTGFELVTQSTSRTVTRYREVTDYETDEKGQQVEVGKHIEPYEVVIEQDTSYIRVTSYEYADIPEPPPEPQEDISEQLEQVKDLIMSVAEKYGAEEAIMQMDDFNIPAIEQLIDQFEVSDEDKAKINYVINFVVIDIMAHLDQTWYRIWNKRVKPALNEMFKQRKAASMAEEDLQDEPTTEPCESCRV